LKKQLMTTTALVVAGVLVTSGAAFAQKKASRPTITLGGWFEAIVGAVDQDETIADHVAVDVQQDAEIHFKGSAKLDNGIRIRTRVELEGQDGGTAIDEAYINVAGGFGQIRIGSEDNAAHLLTTGYLGSWATNVGQNLAFDTGDWIDRPDGHTAGTVNRIDLGDGDSEKITYFTPRIEGLQLGVTYMPAFNAGVNNQAERRTAVHEGYAVGFNYNRKIDKIRVGIAAGYASANPGSGTDQSDPGGVSTGIRIDYGGFRVGFGYSSEWNLVAETALTATGQEAFDYGIRYKTGKNHFSAGYAHIRSAAVRATAGDDEIDHGMFSYRRDLGPGVQYRLNFMWADYEGEDTGSADDNDGMAITTSIRVAF